MRLSMRWDRRDDGVKDDLAEFDRRSSDCKTRVPLSYAEYFRQTAQYRSIALSDGLEDDPLGATVALHVLVEGANESEPAEARLKNLQEAHRLVQTLAPDPSVRVDVGLLRALNALIMRDLRALDPGGRYRSGTTAIVDARTGEIRYRPPKPEHLPSLMDALVEDLNQWMSEGVPGPIVAALAHFGLVSIHPFPDGNGRTARLLADMILAQTANSIDGMLSVSEVLHRRLHEYYDSLRAVQGDDFQEELDVSDWVRQHTRWLREAASLLERRLLRHKQLLEFWKQNFGEVLNDRQQLGLMFAAEVRQLSSPLYARLTGTSTSRAKVDLNGLLQIGALDRVGRGPSTRYRIAPQWSAVPASLQTDADEGGELRRTAADVAATPGLQAAGAER